MNPTNNDSDAPITEQPEPAKPSDVLREVPLSDGSVARFHNRKGRVLKNAQRKAGDDVSNMSNALLSEVITINGRAPLMEELEDLGLFDLLKLQAAFGELSGEAGNVTRTPSP